MTQVDTDTEFQLPTIMPSNLPEPTEVAAQYRAAFASIYTKIEADIAGAEVDLTTKAGRVAVASRAYKISLTKSGLQKASKSLTEEQQAIINVVNAETKTMRETLDGLRDKARAPLNGWEAAEEKRVGLLKCELEYLRDLGRADAMTNPDFILKVIAGTEDCFLRTAWSEYQPMAAAAHEAAIAKFTADLAASEKRISDEAELAELRELKAEQERKAAAEREKQERKDAAARAEKAETEHQRLANERATKDAADKVQAEKNRADKAVADAKQAAIDRVTSEENAEADRIAAAKQAEKDRIEAAAFAVNEERNRQARIAAGEREAKEEREADLAHRKKINNAALVALIKCSEISTAQAKMIVQAMAKGQIPHVTISY